MKKLIPIEERKTKLIHFGANKNFIENIGKIEALKYRVEDVDSAYFYVPIITNYNILKDLNIIPIYTEGEAFRVFGFNDNIQKIFHFELENDEIYNDYGTNWDLLLLDILFQYYNDTIDYGLHFSTFKTVADQLGFQKSETLYKLLDIPIEEYNRKYNNLETWKKELAKTLDLV
jgi:hypothetical protein